MLFSAKNKPILYWFISAIFCLYEVILRVSPCSITETLMCSFSLTCTDFGILIGAYYWAYSILQIPCGFLADRFGTKKVIALSAICCSIGTLIFALTDQFYVALFGRVLIGIGSAAGFITSLKVAADWFSKDQFPIFASLTNVMSTLGGNFGAKPLAFLMCSYGWINVYIVLSLIGIIIAFCAFFFMKNGHINQNSSVEHIKTFFIKTIQNRQIWLVSFIGGVYYLPVSALAELWGSPYLMSVFSITNIEASLSTNLMFMGVAIGSPIFAFLATYFDSYKRLLIIVGFLSFSFLLFITYAHVFSLTTIWFAFFALGVAIGGQILVFSIVKELVSAEISATALGFVNTLISFFGVIFQPFLGFCLDYFWNGMMAENGLRLYSQEVYHQAMFVLPIICLFTLISCRWLKTR